MQTMNPDSETQTNRSTPGDTDQDWRIVPTIPHPEPGVTERYTAAPGPETGLSESEAKRLARGRNRAGEPSPRVTWITEPDTTATGTERETHV